MSTYPLVPLAGVATVRSGYAFKSSDWTESGVPVLKIANIHPGLVDLAGCGFVDEATAAKAQSFTVERDDSLIAMSGASVGKIGRVRFSERALVNQRVGRFSVLDPAKLDADFLYYSLQLPATVDYLTGSAYGSAQPNISPSLILNAEIPLPSLSEQKSITDLLCSLDDKIAANNKTIQLADSLTSALAEDAFSRGNFVPLASIAEITMGNSPKGETLNEDGEGLAFFQGIRDFGVRYPQERVSSTAPTRFAKELDTLFSVRAPVGTVNLAGMPCSIGRGISALSSKTETPYALFQAVRASKIWERYNAEGTVFGSINRKQLEQSEIPWVFHSERYELESTLAGLERLLRTATVMNETLSSIRDTLLPQLMSGKLRVREAEAVVEDVL